MRTRCSAHSHRRLMTGCHCLCTGTDEWETLWPLVCRRGWCARHCGPFVPVVSAGRVNIVRVMERIPCVFLFAFVPKRDGKRGGEPAKLAAIRLVRQCDALRKVRVSPGARGTCIPISHENRERRRIIGKEHNWIT